jgi:selenocysteine lyase/cysteine desulfurase
MTNTPGRHFAPDLMAEIRARFAHVERCPIANTPRIFFENGGGSLKLRAAVERSAEMALLPDQEQRDNDASRHLSRLIEDGRRDLLLFLGASTGQAISGETGTELLYRLIRAVALSAPPGPVMSSNLEHPASHDAAHYWAKATVRRWIDIRFDPRSGTVTPADYARAVTPDTRIATVIHTSQLTGYRVDLAGIVKAIRAVAPDCYVIVDGIQAAPHGAIDVDESGCDGYVFSAYKCYSRLSTGFAWLSDRLTQVPHEHMLGKPVRYWEFGSRDPGIFAAHSTVIDYFCWLGAKFTRSRDRRALLVAGAQAMEAHENALLHLLLFGDDSVRGLSQIKGVRVIGPADLAGRQGIVSFRLDGMTSPALVQALAARGIRTHARITDAYSGHILEELGLPDCLRVSFCHYNSAEEIRALLGAVGELASGQRPHSDVAERARPASRKGTTP